MICKNESYEFESNFHLRVRQVRAGARVERFRMSSVSHGPATNAVRRSKRQPVIGGLCRRRLKSVFSSVRAERQQ